MKKWLETINSIEHKDIPMSKEGHKILLELLDSDKIEHLDHINVKDQDFMFIDIFNDGGGELIVSIGLCDGHASEARIIRI
tara:strand:- start:19 stop:261 length:243 start_codon:yes stop_codon:yes gene_type:complete